MTKRREPLTYHHALTVVASLIGWDRCGSICGVTERSVRYWSDPDCETEIRLIDAERLDRAYLHAGGDHAPFHRLFALRLELSGRNCGPDLAKLAAASAKESGEAVAALIGLSTGATTAETRRSARRELQEAIESLQDALAVVGHEEGASA